MVSPLYFSSLKLSKICYCDAFLFVDKKENLSPFRWDYHCMLKLELIIVPLFILIFYLSKNFSFSFLVPTHCLSVLFLSINLCFAIKNKIFWCHYISLTAYTKIGQLLAFMNLVCNQLINSTKFYFIANRLWISILFFYDYLLCYFLFKSSQINID